VRGAVRVGRLQLVAHQAARGERQARLRQRRAADGPPGRDIRFIPSASIIKRQRPGDQPRPKVVRCIGVYTARFHFSARKLTSA
jgi:hypothetical protein